MSRNWPSQLFSEDALAARASGNNQLEIAGQTFPDQIPCLEQPSKVLAGLKGSHAKDVATGGQVEVAQVRCRILTGDSCKCRIYTIRNYCNFVFRNTEQFQDSRLCVLGNRDDVPDLMSKKLDEYPVHLDKLRRKPLWVIKRNEIMNGTDLMLDGEWPGVVWAPQQPPAGPQRKNGLFP